MWYFFRKKKGLQVLGKPREGNEDDLSLLGQKKTKVLTRFMVINSLMIVSAGVVSLTISLSK